MKKIEYTEIEGNSLAYWGLLAGLGLIMLIGLLAVYHMEHEGHYVTGMTNQVVWGLPHVFAIFLIVAASGALNLASIASVPLLADFRAAVVVGALEIVVAEDAAQARLLRDAYAFLD